MPEKKNELHKTEQNQNAEDSQPADTHSGDTQTGQAPGPNPAEPNVTGAKTAATPQARMDPVRKATFITLGAVVLLLVWYLISDRIVPVTTQARVHALVVPTCKRGVRYRQISPSQQQPASL